MDIVTIVVLLVIAGWILIQVGRVANALLNIIALLAVAVAILVFPFVFLFSGGKKASAFIQKAWALRNKRIEAQPSESAAEPTKTE